MIKCRLISRFFFFLGFKDNEGERYATAVSRRTARPHSDGKVTPPRHKRPQRGPRHVTRKPLHGILVLTGPGLTLKAAPPYLVRTPDALFHRQFTDAASRLALFHGSWALGSPYRSINVQLSNSSQSETLSASRQKPSETRLEHRADEDNPTVLSSFSLQLTLKSLRVRPVVYPHPCSFLCVPAPTHTHTHTVGRLVLISCSLDWPLVKSES